MQRQEAIAFFQRRIAANALDADAHHNLAALYRSRGDAELHARHARIAWLTNCGGPKVWNEHALALMARPAAADEAWQVLQDTMRFWPTFAHSFANAAALLARRGKYNEALPYCLRALELAPGDAALHRNASRLYEQLGRASEAAHHRQHATALAPDDAEGFQRLAMLSLSVGGATDAATQHYSRYRALRGQHYDLKL